MNSKLTFGFLSLAVAMTSQAALAANTDLTCTMNYTANDQTTAHVIQLVDTTQTISTVGAAVDAASTFPDGTTTVELYVGSLADNAITTANAAIEAAPTTMMATLINQSEVPLMKALLASPATTMVLGTLSTLPEGGDSSPYIPGPTQLIATYDQAGKFTGAVYLVMGIPVLCQAK
jgi:hypothetical protein